MTHPKLCYSVLLFLVLAVRYFWVGTCDVFLAVVCAQQILSLGCAGTFHAHLKLATVVVFVFQTRVLVTHGISFLPQVDQIVVLVDGRVSETGSYQDLLSQNGAFADFLRNYLTQEDEDESELDPEGEWSSYG